MYQANKGNIIIGLTMEDGLTVWLILSLGQQDSSHIGYELVMPEILKPHIHGPTHFGIVIILCASISD